jgi:hypothetical protein
VGVSGHHTPHEARARAAVVGTLAMLFSITLTSGTSCGRTSPWGWLPLPRVAHDDDPCVAGGARLCGGPCPELPAPECPGFGCTPTLSTVDGLATGAGVCWSELEDQGARLCPVSCSDGEVCARREDDELVCVAEEVCFDLLTLGGGDGCRYAELSPYDGEALGPSPDDCPPGGAGLLCGGCGCPGVCLGRGPDLPWGVCAHDTPHPPLKPCSLHPSEDELIVDCSPSSLGEEPVCMLFQAEPETLSRAHGVCVKRSRCLALATLTGRVRCYDYEAQRIDP